MAKPKKSRSKKYNPLTHRIANPNLHARMSVDEGVLRRIRAKDEERAVRFYFGTASDDDALMLLTHFMAARELAKNMAGEQQLRQAIDGGSSAIKDFLAGRKKSADCSDAVRDALAVCLGIWEKSANAEVQAALAEVAQEAAQLDLHL